MSKDGERFFGLERLARVLSRPHSFLTRGPPHVVGGRGGERSPRREQPLGIGNLLWQNPLPHPHPHQGGGELHGGPEPVAGCLVLQRLCVTGGVGWECCWEGPDLESGGPSALLEAFTHSAITLPFPTPFLSLFTFQEEIVSQESKNIF